MYFKIFENLYKKLLLFSAIILEIDIRLTIQFPIPEMHR